MRIFCFLFAAWLTLLASASAQQLPDPAKLAPVYQMQRNSEADGRAQCVAIATELQAKVADLEKQLAEVKAKKE